MDIPITTNGPPSENPIAGSPWRLALETLQRVALLVVVHTLSPEARKQLRARWTSDTPDLARAAADVIEAEPEVFHNLRELPRLLREGTLRYQEASDLKSAVDDLQEKATDQLLAEKSALFDQTSTAVDAILTATTSPLVPEAVRTRVSGRARRVGDLLKARRAGIQQTRQNNLRLRAEGDEKTADVSEKLARKELELSILGGTPSPGPQPAPAPRTRGRRARR